MKNIELDCQQKVQLDIHQMGDLVGNKMIDYDPRSIIDKIRGKKVVHAGKFKARHRSSKKNSTEMDEWSDWEEGDYYKIE